jgi:hypothetical protein
MHGAQADDVAIGERMRDRVQKWIAGGPAAAGRRARGFQALQADALDFLGDALTYGITLAVIGASVAVRARAAMFKGLTLSLMGLWVFGATAYHASFSASRDCLQLRPRLSDQCHYPAWLQMRQVPAETGRCARAGPRQKPARQDPAHSL